MKLIIDIPDKKYNAIKEFPMCYTEEVFEQIRQGTPLSEELEKIRQEIHDIEEPDHDFEGFYYCFEEALGIIDKELAKLKGDKE